MRKYTIKNALGHERKLYTDGRFLHSVGDLGYSDETDYRRIGNIYRMIADNPGQGIITGMVYFQKGDPQEAYQDLIAFLQHKPLTLIYTPDGQSVEYMRDGTVTQVTYSETSPKTAGLTFKAHTPPYRVLTEITTQSDGLTGGKIYDYEYNYTYRSARANTVIINMFDTALESPCRIEFEGPLENPEWKQYVNGVETASGKITREVAAGHKVVIDTQSVPYSMKEYDAAGNLVVDLYEMGDFEKERFITLKYGTNTIVVSDEGSHTTSVKVEGKFMYASV